MSDTRPTLTPGSAAHELVRATRHGLRELGGDAQEVWGRDIHRSMLDDTRNSIANAWSNPQAASFMSSNGNTREKMQTAFDSGNYDRAFKSIPVLPYRSVRDEAAAYRDKLIASAPEPQRAQSDNQRQRNAMRQR